VVLFPAGLEAQATAGLRHAEKSANQSTKKTDMVAEDSIALMGLVEKCADGDLGRELGESVLPRLLEIEAEQEVGGGKHERSDGRNSQRNGYRYGAWKPG
jgi:transposase-like protein